MFKITVVLVGIYTGSYRIAGQVQECLGTGIEELGVLGAVPFLYWALLRSLPVGIKKFQGRESSSSVKWLWNCFHEVLTKVL